MTVRNSNSSQYSVSAACIVLSIEAVEDCFGDLITGAEVIEVVKLYFAG